MEKITLENNDSDNWICICGNNPSSDGFYTCDKDGNEVEPTNEAWTTNNYVCARCGRIINQTTLEVVGQNIDFKLLK